MILLLLVRVARREPDSAQPGSMGSRVGVVELRGTGMRSGPTGL